MNIPFLINLSIGFDSFADALYWWRDNEDPSSYPAFWLELNSGWYQLNPKEYRKDFLGAAFADVVYTV